ncbi:MAG: hypothetical protein GXO88_02325 [Chlorobi bacterium]|nr:hypothetical protein [Chlorobiota bacterium]
MRSYLLILFFVFSISFSSCTSKQQLSNCNCFDSNKELSVKEELINDLNFLISKSDGNFELKKDTLILKVENKWIFEVRLMDLDINNGYYKKINPYKYFISIPTKMGNNVVSIKFEDGKVIKDDDISFEIEMLKFKEIQKYLCFLLCNKD